MTYMKPQTDRAVLVGLGEKYSPDRIGGDLDPLKELRQLAETAGAEIAGSLVQTRNDITPRYYIGSGKAEELKEMTAARGATMVIFDNDLAPAQARNLEELLNVKVIDRSGLILDIFALRARTSEAKIQVELAQLRHLLPRLTGRWSHLSRQVGGIGVRGPGETQLEVDRRRVHDRIGHLAQKLKQIEKRGETTRRNRQKMFTVALVGYTNAGKSTLFNALSRGDAPVEDRLFKTLDTMTRRVSGEYLPRIVVSDTVGFIRDLPHELVASFHSTLADVRGADLLLHVIDVTNPDWVGQMAVVEQVLTEIHAGEIDIIPVFNKVDRLENPAMLQGLHARFPDAQFVSARNREGIAELQDALTRAALRGTVQVTVDIDPSNGELISELYRCGTVLETKPLRKKLRLTCSLPAGVAERLGIR